MAPRRFIGLWLGLLGASGVAFLIVWPVFRHFVEVEFPVRPDAVFAERFGHLAAWMVCAGVLVVTLLVGSGLAVRMLRETSRGGGRLGPLVPAAAVALALGASVCLTYVIPSDDAPYLKLYELLGPDRGVLPVLDGQARLLAALGAAATFLAVAAMIGLTHDGRPRGGGSEDDAERVRRRQAMLQTLLPFAGIGLACGVIATAMRLNLQIDVGRPEPVVEAARSVVRTATLGYGAFFTVCLLLGYVPAAMVLRRWCAALSRQALPDGSPDELRKWRVSNDLEDAPTSVAWQVFAAFTPFLASVLGEPVAQALGKLLPG